MELVFVTVWNILFRISEIKKFSTESLLSIAFWTHTMHKIHCKVLLHFIELPVRKIHIHFKTSIYYKVLFDIFCLQCDRKLIVDTLITLVSNRVISEKYRKFLIIRSFFSSFKNRIQKNVEGLWTLNLFYIFMAFIQQ